MELREDSALARQMLEDIGKEIEIDKPLPHVTEIIYCLTRSYRDRFHPLPPTTEEVLLFAVGVGLEKVMLKAHRQHIQGEVDGIHFDTDFLDYHTLPGEFKSTRISEKKALQWFCATGVPAFYKGELIDIPETWVKQVLSYFHCNGATEGTLAVLHLMGNYAPPFPSLLAWRVRTTPTEVAENWEWMLERRDTYMAFVEERRLPPPFHFNLKWECGYCRYKVLCEADSTPKMEGMQA